MAGAPITTDAYVEPVATWQVTLAGQDLTALFAPLLISLKISRARQEKADKLSIVIDDSAGTVALPPANATLTVAMGWAQGTGVTVGLVHMGTFVVDDVAWDDDPTDRITVNAHSADMRDSFRTRKTRTWTAQTLGTIATAIAGEQGLTPRCHPGLASVSVPTAEQHNQSDMEFLRDLGRRYDAVATVLAGALILSPMNAQTTATGATLPTLAITRQGGARASYRRSARDANYQGAEANWYDQNGATRQAHQEGSAPYKRLKRVYATRPDAQAAARSENQRIARVQGALDVSLALGNPAITPGQSCTASGYKSEIDAISWVVDTVDHEMDKSGGFKTTFTLEVAGQSTSTTD